MVSGINKIMSNPRNHYLILSIMASGRSVANGTDGNVLIKIICCGKTRPFAETLTFTVTRSFVHLDSERLDSFPTYDKFTSVSPDSNHRFAAIKNIASLLCQLQIIDNFFQQHNL